MNTLTTLTAKLEELRTETETALEDALYDETQALQNLLACTDSGDRDAYANNLTHAKLETAKLTALLAKLT